jgi:8-oxo-dGTP pyrophosphatase MutT (NUDIX family)
MNKTPSLFHIDRLDLNFTPKPWAYAAEHRAEILSVFAERQREKPALWNGPVLLMHRQVLSEGVFRGDFLQTDFASFSYWHSRGHPKAAVHDCFAAAAIRGADGAFLLGVMGAHTYNSGRIYFPCGTPDPSDIKDGKVDFEFSVQRELKEETGFDISEFDAEPGWTTIVDGALIAQIKVLRSDQSADTLRARILEQLAKETQSELADIRIVRSPADFAPKMPDFVQTFLAHRFAGG